jgi:diguanylate cyclase (GGDEF)-like protein
MTGLLSRRAFEERFRDEADRAASGNSAFSLGFLDIDLFKAVNDTHGHATGDRVIRHVAATIQAAVGAAGYAARYGGEEFAVLLPGIEKEQAFLLLERIRAFMEGDGAARARPDDAVPPFTISGGVAAWPSDGRTRGELVRKADQALYRAKTTGRNRICIAQEERMMTRTSHFTVTQLERLAKLAREEGVGEAMLLREALDDLLIKYRVSDVES